MILIFAIFSGILKMFVNFGVFLGLGVKKPPLGFDKAIDDRLLHSFFW